MTWKLQFNARFLYNYTCIKQRHKYGTIITYIYTLYLFIHLGHSPIAYSVQPSNMTMQ